MVVDVFIIPVHFRAGVDYTKSNNEQSYSYGSRFTRLATQGVTGLYGDTRAGNGTRFVRARARISVHNIGSSYRFATDTSPVRRNTCPVCFEIMHKPVVGAKFSTVVSPLRREGASKSPSDIFSSVVFRENIAYCSQSKLAAARRFSVKCAYTRRGSFESHFLRNEVPSGNNCQIVDLFAAEGSHRSRLFHRYRVTRYVSSTTGPTEPLNPKG